MIDKRAFKGISLTTVYFLLSRTSYGKVKYQFFFALCIEKTHKPGDRPKQE